MDKGAISQIQTTALAAAANSELRAKYPDIPAVVLPTDSHLLSLEKYLPAPARFRAAFSTRSLKDFVYYVRNAVDAKKSMPEIFVDAEGMVAKSHFDLGSSSAPGHDEWTAALKLKATGDYTDLLNRHSNRLSQKALAEFFEDFRDLIDFIDADGTEMNFGLALAAIRNVDVKQSRESTHTDESMSASRSSFEKIEASSKRGALPWGIKFRCATYESLAERAILCRLSLLTGDEKPAFTLRIVRQEKIEQEAAQEFSDKVDAELSEIAIVMIGSLSGTAGGR